MSYDISIYHPSVKHKIDEGFEIDEFEHQPIEAVEMQTFLDRLQRYGYRLESETPRRKGFVKKVAGCPVQVGVFSTMISFSVPYWKKSEGAIFEALQDASELCDSGGLALFNPQTGEWLDPDTGEWFAPNTSVQRLNG